MDQKQSKKEKTKEAREKSAAWQRAYYQNNPSKRREALLKCRFGITVAEYDKMLEQQNHTCAICLQPRGLRRLAVDHCHKSQRIRGLLCGDCNRGIGMLRDSVENLKRAINYLERTE